MRQDVRGAGTQGTQAEVREEREVVNYETLRTNSDIACKRIWHDVLYAAMKRRRIDTEPAVQKICDELWFPAGYRVDDLTIVQYPPALLDVTALPRTEIRPHVQVGALTLWMRRQWRKVRPYRYSRFLGKAVTR